MAPPARANFSGFAIFKQLTAFNNGRAAVAAAAPARPATQVTKPPTIAFKVDNNGSSSSGSGSSSTTSGSRGGGRTN